MTDLSFTRAEKYRPVCKANHIATQSTRGGKKRGRKRERDERRRKTNRNRKEREIKATQNIVRENRGRKYITPAYGWHTRLIHWLSVRSCVRSEEKALGGRYWVCL